jgi:hypothetical protein
MSHFTVLVVTKVEPTDEDGSELSTLMEPYAEDREVEPYWTDEADSFETWWDRKYHVDEGHVPADVTFEGLMAFFKSEGDGDQLYRLTADGKVERQTTYNPDSKWDYYRIGGRWSGRLKLKPDALTGRVAAKSWDSPEGTPEGVDVARKGDVDLEGMRDAAATAANARWDALETVLAVHGTPQTFAEIAQKQGVVLDYRDPAFDKDAVQPVRDEYNGQGAIEALRKSDLVGFMDSYDESFHGHTRESYVAEHRAGMVPAYAFLSAETEWLAPGEMGWFGMSSDNRASRLEYYDKVNAIVDAAPDDAWLVMLDCHI